MAVLFIDKENFEEKVMRSDKPVLLDFSAIWCGPCKMMAPVFAKIAEEHPELVVGKVDVDDSPELAMKYGISAVPTFLLVRDGQEVKRTAGYQSEEELLRTLLG